MHISKGIQAISVDPVTLPNQISEHLYRLAYRASPKSYWDFGFEDGIFGYRLDNEMDRVHLFCLPLIVVWSLDSIEKDKLIYIPNVTATNITTGDDGNKADAETWLGRFTLQLDSIGIGMTKIYREMVILPTPPWLKNTEPFYCLKSEVNDFVLPYMKTLTDFLLG